MHYSFDAYPLAYVAAALALFGVPMTCIFLAAMKSMSGGFNSQKSAPPSRSLASVTPTLAIVKSVPPTPHKVASPAKTAKVTRRRALEVKISWVSLPAGEATNNL